MAHQSLSSLEILLHINFTSITITICKITQQRRAILMCFVLNTALGLILQTASDEEAIVGVAFMGVGCCFFWVSGVTFFGFVTLARNNFLLS
jgi:hypothetical protein